MKWWKSVIAIVVLGVVGGLGYLGYVAHRYATVTVPNAYAVEWVGSMVVGYLRQNDGRWPQSWDDLRPIYDQHVEKSGRPWTFEELKSRVVVEWDVDVERLRQMPPSADGPPFRVIRLRDGGQEYWGGHEPNAMVHRYLTELDGR